MTCDAGANEAGGLAFNPVSEGGVFRRCFGHHNDNRLSYYGHIDLRSELYDEKSKWAVDGIGEYIPAGRRFDRCLRELPIHFVTSDCLCCT
jgi:hypothetical protein